MRPLLQLALQEEARRLRQEAERLREMAARIEERAESLDIASRLHAQSEAQS